MSLSVDAAETFLAERHITAAEHLGMSPRAARQFLDDAALDELAETIQFYEQYAAIDAADRSARIHENAQSALPGWPHPVAIR